MGLTSKLSNSLGVEESGLRFILSMISGVVSKDSKIQLSVSNYIINIFSIVIFCFRLSLVPFSQALLEKNTSCYSTCILCTQWYAYLVLEYWFGLRATQFDMYLGKFLLVNSTFLALCYVKISVQVTWGTVNIFKGSTYSTIAMYIFQVSIFQKCSEN